MVLTQHGCTAAHRCERERCDMLPEGNICIMSHESRTHARQQDKNASDNRGGETTGGISGELQGRGLIGTPARTDPDGGHQNRKQSDMNTTFAVSASTCVSQEVLMRLEWKSRRWII